MELNKEQEQRIRTLINYCVEHADYAGLQALLVLGNNYMRRRHTIAELKDKYKTLAEKLYDKFIDAIKDAQIQDDYVELQEKDGELCIGIYYAKPDNDFEHLMLCTSVLISVQIYETHAWEHAEEKPRISQERLNAFLDTHD